jgi:hypothetical protein
MSPAQHLRNFLGEIVAVDGRYFFAAARKLGAPGGGGVENSAAFLSKAGLYSACLQEQPATYSLR